MEAKERQQSSYIKQTLCNDFFSFSFFKAVSLIESAFPENKRLGVSTDPNLESVCFKVKPGFEFPASDISSLLSMKRKDSLEMIITFLGLVGPSGALPEWYNEIALKEDLNFRKNKNSVKSKLSKLDDYNKKKKKYASFSEYIKIESPSSPLTDFFNIFHHRLISLFYLAWKKNKLPEIFLPELTDSFSQILLHLLGLGTFSNKTNEKIGFSTESLFFFSGLLSRLPTKETIITILEDYLGLKVRVETFIEQQVHLSDEDMTCLGTQNLKLGLETTCGNCTWENQSKFRIHLDELNYENFNRLLPTNKIIHKIFSLVRYIVGIEYEFDIRLYLKQDDIPLSVFKDPSIMLLGWTSSIKSKDSDNYFVQKRKTIYNNYITFQESDIQVYKKQ